MRYSSVFLALSVANVASAQNLLHTRSYEVTDFDDAFIFPRDMDDAFVELRPRVPGVIMSKSSPGQASGMRQDKATSSQMSQKPAGGGSLGHSRVPPDLRGTDRQPRRLKTFYTGRMKVPDAPPTSSSLEYVKAGRRVREYPKQPSTLSRAKLAKASADNGEGGQTTKTAPGKESGNGSEPSQGKPQTETGPSGTQKMTVKPGDANSNYRPPKKDPTKNLDITRDGFKEYYTPAFRNTRWERPLDKPENPTNDKP